MDRLEQEETLRPSIELDVAHQDVAASGQDQAVVDRPRPADEGQVGIGGDDGGDGQRDGRMVIDHADTDRAGPIG